MATVEELEAASAEATEAHKAAFREHGADHAATKAARAARVRLLKELVEAAQLEEQLP